MLHLFCAATFKALLKSPDELSVISSYDGRCTYPLHTFTHTQVWLAGMEGGDNFPFVRDQSLPEGHNVKLQPCRRQ